MFSCVLPRQKVGLFAHEANLVEGDWQQGNQSVHTSNTKEVQSGGSGTFVASIVEWFDYWEARVQIPSGAFFFPSTV